MYIVFKTEYFNFHNLYLHLNFIDDSTLEQNKKKPTLMNIRIFHWIFKYYFAFVKVITSHIFHYEQFWYQDWISHSLGEGNIKKPRLNEFHSNQFYKQYNTSEQIHPSIKFIIILSYIESKKKYCQCIKKPIFPDWFFCLMYPVHVWHVHQCTFSIPGSCDCKKKKTKRKTTSNYLLNAKKKCLHQILYLLNILTMSFACVLFFAC